MQLFLCTQAPEASALYARQKRGHNYDGKTPSVCNQISRMKSSCFSFFSNFSLRYMLRFLLCHIFWNPTNEACLYFTFVCNVCQLACNYCCKLPVSTFPISFSRCLHSVPNFVHNVIFNAIVLADLSIRPIPDVLLVVMVMQKFVK